MVAKPPIDTSHQSPNRNGYAGTRRVEAIVWHVTAGGFGGSLSWLCSPAAGASANYLIDKDGTRYELVPPDQDAWANGQVDHPDTTNPAIARWLREGVNFNQRTISIETVRETSANNQPGGFTTAQRDSLIALTAWLCERFGVTPDRTHILRHAQVDSINRPYCPGLAESELQAWVGRIAALVKGGGPTVQDSIATGIGAQPEGIDTHIDARGHTIMTIDFGGEATEVKGFVIPDAGVTIGNAQGETWHRSVQQNTFGTWVKEG